MKTDMIYRSVGKTGLSASVIGLGAEHLDNKPYKTVEDVIHASLDYGINIIDAFMPGDEVRQFIGRALKGRRDKVLIQGHICSTDINKQYDISRDRKSIQKYFEALLQHLKTDYIDFGMLFFIDTEQHFKEVFHGDALPYALELKKKGHIRHLGASSHNPIIARKIVESGLVDIIMFSINPAFDMVAPEDYIFDNVDKLMAGTYKKNLDPHRQDFYKYCEQQSVAITVMKTLGAAKLLKREFTPFSQPLTVAQCIHYALTRPAVVSALLGCSETSHVEEAVSYLNASDEERDYTGVIESFQGSMKGSCVYCSHCQPCPSELDIASIMKYVDIACLDGENVPAPLLANYKSLKLKASECMDCGSCEGKCPFSVPIMENMKKAVKIFSE